MKKREKQLVFLLSALVLAIGILCPKEDIWAKTDKNAYYSNTELTEDQMCELFLKGYKTIISRKRTNTKLKTVNANTFTTQYSRTTCLSIDKREYGLIGYSKKAFGTTATTVFFPIPKTSINLSFSYKGLTMTLNVPIQKSNYERAVEITDKDKKKIKRKRYRSCLKMEAYLTNVNFKTENLDSSRRVISTKKWKHTYCFDSMGERGVDYELVVKSPKDLKQIKKNKYMGTNKEKKAMNKFEWNTYKTNKASIYP